MIKMMNRISSTAMMAVAFMLCATSAWADAPTATAVWESGQFGQTKNGYSISYTGHTINGNGNIVINGSSSAAATIILTNVTAAGETKVTLLYKYKTLTNPSDCRYGATVCYNDTSKDYVYDMGFVSWSAANRGLLPAWHKDTSSFGVNKYSNEQPNFTSAMSSDGGYVIFSYDKTQSTISGYQGASLATVTGGSQTGYYFGGYDGKITHVGIGGPTGQTSANKWGAWGGLEIEKVAIFVGSIYSNSDLADYKWPSEVMRETLPERDMINLNISNGDSFAITGFGVDTISTLAGEMLDNAWQNTPSGNAVVSGDARNGRVTGVTAYDGSSKEATTLSNVMFTWAVEGSGTANYGYQDIENNPTFHKAWLARYSTVVETSSILVQSIPYRKYDIIVYCFGADDSAFNPVFVNGIPYVGDTSLATDTKTRKATSSSETWGVRRASPSLGQTAIMLKGLENPELSLTIRSGATSICAVQIVRDMSEGVWPTSKKVISLNLMSAKSSSGTTPAIYGLEPVPDAAWTKDGLSTISSSGTDVSATIMEWNGSSAVEASGVTVNEKAANAHNWSGYSYTPQNQILSGYLDDTSRQIAITVTDVPYDVYDVIVYCATDNSNKQFGPVKVNDTPYRWDDDKQCAVVASSADSTAETRWGATQSRLPAYGRNAIRIPNQTRSTLTIIGANNANNARGGIAAIQIVEAHSGLKVYSNGSWSGGTEPTSGDAVIVVDGDTALAIDGTANLGTVTITGTGTLTLSGSGKFTATTIAVESLATVNANPDRLDATTYVGSGTVVYSGGAPETGKGWTDSANWTGTVEIDDLSFGYSITLATYGNANSVVCMNNVEAPLTLGESDHNIKELKIGSYGFDQIGAYSSGGAKNFNLPFKLTGSGVYTIATTGSDEKSVNFQGDASEFAGKIVFAGSENNSRVVFGASTSRAFQDGSIVIGANGILKIAYPMQWSITKAPVYVDQTGLLENTGGLLDVAYGFKIDGTLKTPGIGFAWNKMSSATGFALGDTGVLELTSSENTNDATTGSTPAPTSVDMSKVTGTGTLKYTSTAGWRAFTDNDAYMPATTLTIQVELADSLIITKCDNGETVIGNLAGGKNIRSDWTPAGSNNRTLTVTQSKDTKWDGKFVSNRITQFNVVPPAEGTPGTLTLNGTNTETIPMQVNGSVNLTGTWGGATTVAGTFGGTGTLTGNLTFNAGSTFKAFARDEDDDDGLTVTGSVTYPASGTVTVDVSDITLSASGTTLITFASAPSADDVANKMTVSGAVLSLEENVLKAYPIAVLKKANGDDVVFSSVQDAVDTTENENADYQYITVNKDGQTVNAVGTTLKVKYGTGVSSITVNSPSAEYAVDGGVADGESGITTYSITPTANTYTWAATGDGVKSWTDPANWTYGSGSAATRYPTAIDSVVFNNGATVTIAGAECAAITVSGAVEIAGSGDLKIYGSVTDGGSGALTLSGVCLNNWAEESSTGVAITVAPTVRFVDGAGIASNKRGAVTINGAVSIGGLFKLWDIATVSFSGGLSVDSGATLQLNQNLDLSSVTTVFNGNFSKTVNNNESTTLTLGAVTVSSSTTPTISAGTIVLSGTVTVSDGATFTIPASGVTVSGATFDLAAVNSVLVAPESLSVNVDTSVDGKIVKHVTDAGNTTYSVADAVATFGGTPYGSIANAIEAAVAASGGTVTLVDNSSEDITLPNGVSFCDGGYTYTGEITTDTANHVYYNTTTDAGVTTYSALSAEASVTANAVTTYYATFDAAKAVAGANTITLLTDITINVAENDTLTISSPIAGSFGITKTGAGTLVLSGYNTYTGATTIDSGVLDLQNAIHANNTTYEVAATAKLRLAASTGFVATSVTLRGTLEVASTAQVVQIPVLNAYNGSHIKYTASQAVIVGSMAMLDEGSVAIDISDALGAEGATLRLIQITNASLNVVSLGDVPTGYILGLSGTNAIIAYIPVATIGGTPYQTLSDAVSAASNGDTITLTRNDNSAINIHRKSITFVEDGGVFTGTFASEYDAYGTYGTLILTELLESADTNTLFENGGWAGTVVLPNGLPASNLNLNHYGARYNNQGHSWSTVQIQGIDSGHLANATVDPIVELVGNMRLTSCSQSFANTFEVVKGAGDFDLSAAELSGGSTYAYFLLKNVANFTGSLKTKAGGAGIVLGGTTKPTGTDDLGKIIVNTAATIGAGETWVAPGGVRVSEGVVVTMGAGGSISGTVTLKVGASVKIPDGTAAPTVTTDVPYYTVTSTTVAGVTTYTIVKKPGTIFSVY